MRNAYGSTLTAMALTGLVAVGCGGEGGGEAGGEAGGGDGAQVEFPVAEDQQATVTGTVSFAGTPPGPEQIDMGEEPTCADKHDGTPTRQAVVVGDGTLGNVYVYVKEGLDGNLRFPTPDEAVELDQDGCIYHPHVLGVQTGQTLEIANSDGILHNINATPDNNQGFNISQPVEMTSERTFRAAEVMIPVRCDVHGWMEAYIGVQDHPYFAVTGEDGTFTLERLPPGEYVIEAWHERYGTQTASVTVEAGGEAQVSFEFDEAMAAGAVVPLGEPIDLHDHSAERTVADASSAPGRAGQR